MKTVLKLGSLLLRAPADSLHRSFLIGYPFLFDKSSTIIPFYKNHLSLLLTLAPIPFKKAHKTYTEVHHT